MSVPHLNYENLKEKKIVKIIRESEINKQLYLKYEINFQ